MVKRLFTTFLFIIGIYTSMYASITYSFSADSVLTLRGTGQTSDYSYKKYNTAPWIKYSDIAKKIVIEEGITGLGEQAFRRFGAVTSVSFPSSLTYIGSSAFEYCTSLTDIEWSDNIKSIGNDAFRGCESLTSLRIPDSVTLALSSFVDCSSLTSVTIGSGLTTISNTFEGCTALKHIDIPYNVSAIRNKAFARCFSLASIELSYNVDYIGDGAFESCTSLASAIIGYSVTSIGENAFKNCDNLNDVTCYAETPPTVKSSAFSHYGVLHVSEGMKEKYKNASVWRNFTILENAGKEDDLICQGTCGDNAMYKITSDSTLTISGTGNMTNYAYGKYAPWYEYRSIYRKVVIENGITSIGDYAFYHNTFTQISIPSTVAVIGQNAFTSCVNLASVSIPDGVTTIKDEAFCNCSALKTIVIPNSVTTLGESVFYYCRGLTSAIIGDNVTSLRHMVFFSCSALESIHIGKGVSVIEQSAFSGCESLKAIDIPDNVKSIGALTFMDCSNLASITIGSGVDNIGTSLFGKHHCLKSIKVRKNNATYDSRQDCNCIIETSTGTLLYGCQTSFIPDGVKHIGGDAFGNSRGLTSIKMPASVLTIGNFAFGNCDNLRNLVIGPNVTRIGDSAFENCCSLVQVTIPASVSVIEDNAFYGCDITDLTNLADVPQAVGSQTFSEYNKLHVKKGLKDAYSQAPYWKKFTIADDIEGDNPGIVMSGTCGLNVKYVLTSDGTLTISGSGDMKNFSSYSYAPWHSVKEILERVVIEDGVTSIGDRVFYDCNYITWVSIPGTVTSIGTLSFNYCTALPSIEIPGSVTSIGEEAFAHCSSLSRVGLRNGLKTIGKYAFADCEALNSVFIPASVTYIGEEAFEHCTSLTSVVIDNSPAVIDMSAFHQCKGLESVSLGNNLTSIGMRAFDNCTSLTSISIPNSVATIGTGAFWECTSLQSAIVGNGNGTTPADGTRIGSNTFKGCSALTSVVLAGHVTHIDSGTFWGCNKLADVTNLADTPQSLYRDTFTHYGTLHVKKGKGALFKAAFYWENFYIVEDAEGPVELERGSCGENLTYALTSDGVLTVNGTGEMTNCNFNNTPWYNSRESIRNVVISEGVTSIGEEAFLECRNLESLTIAASVKKIGEYAFYYSGKLIDVTNYADEPQEIGYKTFGRYGTLHVKKGTKTLYENDDKWRYFTIIEDITDASCIIIHADSTKDPVHSIYDTVGHKLNGVHKGVNILRMADGTTRKVLGK